MATMRVASFRVLALVAVAAVCGALSAAKASPVTVTLNVGFQTKYDYQSGSYQPFTGSGQVVLTFENTQSDAQDYGATTVAHYYGGTKFKSPFTSGFIADPFGGGPSTAFEYTFPNVSDYSSTFIEQFAAQGNTYSSSGSQAYSYHIEMRITKNSPPQGGFGVNDYAFSPSQNVAFLQDAMLNPSNYQFYFAEYAQTYDTSKNHYTAGYILEDYSVRISSIVASAIPVPEPTSMAALVTGLASLMGLHCLRHRAKRCVP